MDNGTCSIPDCEKRARARGWCSMHYERNRKHGSPHVVLPPVDPPRPPAQTAVCQASDCNRKPWARNYCDRHYQAFRKYGDSLENHRKQRAQCTAPDCSAWVHGHGLCTKHYLRMRNTGTIETVDRRLPECRIDGCSTIPTARAQLCELHDARIRRHGDPHLVIDTRQPDAGYRSAHARIARDRGKASTKSCVDCGRQAHHWSYDHTDVGERESLTGQPYSLDTSHYSPRCAPCHAIFDGTGANQYTRAR